MFFNLATLAGAEDKCLQPPPAEMAKAAGVELPRYPWHTAVVTWLFEEKTENFSSLEIDITIDRDVPEDYNLYISPCGGNYINGLLFYGGLQTNINGWANMGEDSRERVYRGKGAIFSRWSSDRKTPIDLHHLKPAADDCLVESAGYEGEFASVRRPLAWTKGTYTYRITKGRSEVIEGKDHTWFDCSLKDSEGNIHEVGSLRFEGKVFSHSARNAAFVEVYSTAKIPASGIPKVVVTFGWPRFNGEKPTLKEASALYKDPANFRVAASPDCANATADGENIVIELGPIFERDDAKRRHKLDLQKESAPEPAR